MEGKTKLAAAIITVMKEVQGMEKRAKVGEGQNAYNGTKDQDVKEVFNTAMANAGLCILPIDIQEETAQSRWEEPDYKGVTRTKQSIFTKVKTKYLLLHESGESIELAGYGHGIDTQDKSAGKATTYALKNTLLYTFLTPVGKIDDTDQTHSDDLPVQPPTQKKKAEPKEKPLIALPRTDESGAFTARYTQVITKARLEGKTLKDIKQFFKIAPEDEDDIERDLLT